MATDISVKIGVDGEKEFRTALAGINSQLKNLDAEMKAAMSSLSGMDDAEQQAAKQSDILARSIEANGNKIKIIQGEYTRAANKLNDLSDALKKAEKEFGENSLEATKARNAYNRQTKAVNDLGTKLNSATADLNKMERELKDIDNSAEKAKKSLNELGDSAESVGNGLTGSITAGSVGGFVAGIVQNIANGIKNLVSETMEYNKVMSVLEASSKKAGYTAGQTRKSYKQLYGVIGDNQSTATALANLQAVGLAQDDLATLIDGTIGAWAKYGDSIPIDSLAEAVNETIKVGTVTGTFADVLNWAGTSEDEFNKRLQETADPAERAKIVLDELSKQGLPELADAYREANPEIVKMNEANAELEKSLGKIGEFFTPLVAGITEGIAKLLEKAKPMMEEIGRDFLVTWEGIEERVSPFVEKMKDSFSEVGEAIDTAFTDEEQNAIKNFFATLEEIVVSGPIIAITAIIRGIATAIKYVILFIGKLVDFFTEILPNAIDTVIKKFKEIVNTISGVINAIGGFISGIASTLVAFFTETIPGAIEAAIQWISHLPGKIWEILTGIVQTVVNWATKLVETIKNKMQEFQAAIISNVKTLPSKFVQLGKDILQGLLNGLTSLKNKVFGFFSNIGESIIGKFKSIFGIASPSKVFRWMGNMLMDGLGLGIKDGETTVINIAEELNDRLIEKEEELVKKLEAVGLDDATKAALTAQLETTKKFREEYQSAIAEIESAQTSLADKLSDYGKLFVATSTKTGSYIDLTNMQDDIDAITKYGEALESLKNRGISDSLMDEILSLSVDDAIAYTNKLLNMTDEEYAKYVALWEEKQAIAQEVARKFYQDELDALAEEFVGKLPAEMSEIKDDMRTIGVDSIRGLINGMYSQTGALYSAARTIIQQAIAAMRKAADIHSPSGKTQKLIGVPLAQGVINGFVTEMKSGKAMMDAAMLSPFRGVTSGDVYSATEGLVNGVASQGISPQNTQTIIIPVQLNGKQIAEVVYDPLKDVAMQRGQTYG